MKENQKSYTFIETRSWLVCFLWVLKNINRQMLQNWWKRDTTPKRKKALLDILADLLGVTLATLLTKAFYQLRGRYRARRAVAVLAPTDD